uniref:Uncharacterized protein n=1 Tax=Romanomermis culicivorax TaxID=13658 RepID=A0A915J577_ROMCU
MIWDDYCHNPLDELQFEMSQKDDEIQQLNVKIDKMADSMIGVQELLEKFVLDQREKDIRVSRTTDRPLQTQSIGGTLPITSATCIANDQRLQQMEVDESEQKFTVKPAVKSKVSTEKRVTEPIAVREQASDIVAQFFQEADEQALED